MGCGFEDFLDITSHIYKMGFNQIIVLLGAYQFPQASYRIHPTQRFEDYLDLDLSY